MNEDAYAKELIAVLDNSLPLLRPEVAGKLQVAREQACALASQRAGSHSFRSAHSLTWTDWVRQHRIGLVGMLLVMALGGGTAVWQSSGGKDDNTVSIDTDLLTGDLPVNAYLDGHLSKWVSNSSAY
ncbi:MAG: DUF3619 family protein [Sulfuriferula sp.]